MKRVFLLGVVLLSTAWAGTVTAQTAREEIKANKYLAGSNYLDYDRHRSDKALTPAPKGYVPFYMSHYGRHGSRWLISEDSYTSVVEPLQKAQQAGKLTAKGTDVLKVLEAFLPTTIDRLGDLTTVGERQHHGIAKRMVQNFPEIFKTKGVQIDARSTTVNRCILSMTAECEELAAANPSARIHNDVSKSLQYYLNQERSGLVKSLGRKGREVRRKMGDNITPDRLMGVLFNDQQWVKEHINAWPLMSNLFEITTNMQSHDDGADLYWLFTEDELYEQWHMRNLGWYIDYAAAPQTDAIMPFTQRNLLRNIIETADTVTQTQAALRFGHEVCVMPLACLLELGNCGVQVADLKELDAQWRNYDIFPMASNIQLVFYRKAAGKGQHNTTRSTREQDILVKAMLNEREVTLPVETTTYPYYKWSDLRAYYLQKLASYDAKEAAMPKVKEVDEQYTKYYKNLPVEVEPVKRPTIPRYKVNLKDMGGVGDGVTLNTEAFSKAIDKLAAEGGGRLVVPQGIWLTGPIHLKSNIELHLERNAVIYMSPDKQLFVNPDDPQGKCFSGINATDCKNVAITGKGVVDGNGADWYYVKRDKLSDVEWKARLERGGQLAEKGSKWYPWNLKSAYGDIAPTAEKQEHMRADLVRLWNCENVLLEGVTFQNSPRFHIHPFYCKNLIIDGINVRCPWNAQNGDGIDITDCHQVLLVRSNIDVGDDGMCFKSDPPKTGLISGNEDVVAEDNFVRHAHGGFVLGSNTSSGMRRMVVRNNTFSDTDTGLRFKSGIGRGGKTEQLYISDIMMTNIAHEAIIFQCDYAGKAPNETTDLYKQKKYMEQFTPEERKWTPDFQDIHIENITCLGAQTAIKAAGLTGLDCVHDIDIKNSTFVYRQAGQQIDEETTKIDISNVKLIQQ
ncbi:MAG: glycoside hydrolase family 28 protein [Prevotella sp.]|nr:glycoside hydrolase family 28 protein [Prevotella sp.]